MHEMFWIPLARWTFPQLTTFSLCPDHGTHSIRSIWTTHLANSWYSRRRREEEIRREWTIIKTMRCGSSYKITLTNQKDTHTRRGRQKRKELDSIESEHFWNPTISFHLSPPTHTHTHKAQHLNFFRFGRSLSPCHCKLLFSSTRLDSSFFDYFFLLSICVNNVFLFRVSCTIFVHITNK